MKLSFPFASRLLSTRLRMDCGVPELHLNDATVRQLLNGTCSTMEIGFGKSRLMRCGLMLVRTNTSLSPITIEKLLTTLGRAIGRIIPDVDRSLVQSIDLRDPLVSGSQFALRSLADDPYRAMPLHTDGAFDKIPPDWVGLAKTHEHQAGGGETLCLRLDEWDDCERFAVSPYASHPVRWTLPRQTRGFRPRRAEFDSSVAPIFERDCERRRIRFARHCISQETLAQSADFGDYVNALEQSLMSSIRKIEVRLNIGDMYFVNNRRVLHGRNRFQPHRELSRSVIRVRGQF